MDALAALDGPRSSLLFETSGIVGSPLFEEDEGSTLDLLSEVAVVSIIAVVGEEVSLSMILFSFSYHSCNTNLA